MSSRPSTAEKSTGNKGRQRYREEPTEDTERRPLNLGCGTLLVLFLAVATAGKFLPHGDKAAKSQAKPALTQRGESAEAGDQKPTPDKTSTPAKVRQPAPVATKVEKPKPAAIDTPSGQAANLLHELGQWISQRDPPVTAPAVAKPPVTARGPDKPAGSPERVPSPGQPKAPTRPVKAPATQTAAKPDSPVSASSKPRIPPSSGKPPNQTPAAAVESPKALAPVPPPGKAVVFNSPWNQSVEQVERYLKRHAHNADSIEVMEWGKVARVGQGYQVRCTFRSRNVLGKVATASKVFVLDKNGEVTDILD